MSAKLVVQKFESDVSFKYLNVIIEDDDKTRFSEWLNGEDLNSEKRIEKSSHLIVKIVSSQEYDHFNLDFCAKELNKPPANKFENNGDISVDTRLKSNHDMYNFSERTDMFPSPVHTNTMESNNCSQHDYIHNVSPLEYSLERVKETNARIMQNIHMLNRTLNYTKKKEILDIACPKSVRSYPCNTCGKCFVYETGLRRHYTMRHSMIDAQPRWQVVWTCIECFQVWPRQDVATQHALQCCQVDNIDNIREIKTSSLLQCEFCEKVYTSIPRLLRHAKTHTTANNYECNACEMVFSSYKSAEQHWLSCSWLMTCYTFYLPKLLLCNACDRKFRNYEQLYNHRYKVSHFITKTHHNQSHVKALGVLVYQCEICGQWFPSVALLRTHRIHHHPLYDSVIQAQDTNYKDNETFNLVIGSENMHKLENITDQQY